MKRLKISWRGRAARETEMVLREEEVGAEEVEAPIEPAEEAGEAGEEEEEEVVDLNAALLEVMIRRTEILEKLAAGALPADAASKMLNEIAVPTTRRRRRRRTSSG